MSDSNLVLLLQLIRAGGDVDALLSRGLEFAQIAQLLGEAIERGYVTEGEDSLQLSDKGIEKMRAGAKGLKMRRDGGWISPLDDLRIEKSAPDEIYLPDEETALSLGQGH